MFLLCLSASTSDSQRPSLDVWFFMLPHSRRFEECVADRTSHAQPTPQTAPGIPDIDSDVGSVLVVLPTFNEVATITETIRRVRAARPDIHILVVDDNSPDGTANTVAAVAEQPRTCFC